MNALASEKKPTNRVYRVAVIPGDGIGKEVVPEGVRVLETAAQKFGFEPFATSIQRVAERRNSQARIAAPIGSPYGKACPSSGRELPAHDADRRASRRSTAAFSLDLGTAF